MEQVYVERLRTLYSVMAGIPARVVYMSVWRSERARDGYAHNRLSDEKLINQSVEQLTHQVHDVDSPNHVCNTAACAIGWATAYPEFKEAGLHMDNAGHPAFAGLINWDALQNFFGATEYEVTRLFSPINWRENYNNPNKSQKEIFLIRLRELLVNRDIITQERSNELALIEEDQAKKDKITTYIIES